MEQNENTSLLNLLKIFSSNGEDKEAWSELLCNIITSNMKFIQETISFLKQNLINKEKVELTLDIIDFLVCYGSQEVIEQISQKDFLACILVLLKNKSKSKVEVQKKIIFLTQKWHQKFENEQNNNLKGFADNYNSLKNGGIIFPPPSFKIKTYDNYISEDESQTTVMKANTIKKLTKETEEVRNSLKMENPFADNVNNINNNIFEENENNINNIKKDEDSDEENPYLQNNEDENNNINNNNHNNFNNNNNINNYNNNNEDNNLPKLNEIYTQKSNYPNYPAQMNNFANDNNKNYVNNNQNNNQYANRSKSMNTQNNNFSNNNFNNFNNNNNFNMNNNYNNFQNNNNNFPNNNINYNNNNTNNFQGQNDCTIEAKYYKKLLGNKLLQLNSWINEGKYSFNSGKLKEGIQEILNEIPNCNNMMRNYQSKGDKRAFDIIKNMRNDIEQTCSRYEALMTDKPLEPFFSSFSGNTRQYFYSSNEMFGIPQNCEMGNFDNYYKSSGLANYGNYNTNYQNQETFGDKLSGFGHSVKNGLITFGKAVKNTAVSGYEFVKKKIDSDN